MQKSKSRFCVCVTADDFRRSALSSPPASCDLPPRTSVRVLIAPLCRSSSLRSSRLQSVAQAAGLLMRFLSEGGDATPRLGKPQGFPLLSHVTQPARWHRLRRVGMCTFRKPSMAAKPKDGSVPPRGQGHFFWLTCLTLLTQRAEPKHGTSSRQPDMKEINLSEPPLAAPFKAPPPLAPSRRRKQQLETTL